MLSRGGSGAFDTVGAVGAESGSASASAAAAGTGAAKATGAGAAEERRARGAALRAVSEEGAAADGAAPSGACSRRQMRHPLGPNARECRSQRARILELTATGARRHGAERSGVGAALPEMFQNVARAARGQRGDAVRPCGHACKLANGISRSDRWSLRSGEGSVIGAGSSASGPMRPRRQKAITCDLRRLRRKSRLSSAPCGAGACGCRPTC